MVLPGRIFSIYGALGGLASLLAVEAGADLLNLPNWFKETAAAAAVIGSTVLFLKYISSRDKAQSERDAARDVAQEKRDQLFANTLTSLADDFREDREKDREERREGWQYLREAVQAMRNPPRQGI